MTVWLHHRDDGPRDAAHTLLLVHGWGSDGDEWAPHIPRLARTYRVLTPDLRGHGRSGVPDTGNRPPEMAADLWRLARSLGIGGGLVAVGHSLGAQVVTHLAVRHPSLVAALVVIDPGYGFTERQVEVIRRGHAAMHATGDPHRVAMIGNRVSYTPGSPARLRQEHQSRMLATPGHVLAESMVALVEGPGAIGPRPRAEEYLRRRRCPVLALWCDPAKADWESRLSDHPASESVAWPGAGHRLHEERPEEFLDTLIAWLARALPEAHQDTGRAATPPVS